MTSKTCVRCKRLLQASAFARDPYKSDGLGSYCRECRADMHQERKAQKWVRENKPRRGR